MKRLVFIAAIAASMASFGTRVIECGTETKVLSPVKITAVTAASTNLTGTVTVTNRIDVSYFTNCVTRVVSTNGWTAGVGGAESVPVVRTNSVVRSFRVERHVDVPVGSVTLSGGYGSATVSVHASPGDRLVTGGTKARVFVFGD